MIFVLIYIDLFCNVYKDRNISLIHDNTKPFARMGRKAYRVSPRQPGRRNITGYWRPGFFVDRARVKSNTKGGDTAITTNRPHQFQWKATQGSGVVSGG